MARRTIVIGGQLLVLAVIGWGLYVLAGKRAVEARSEAKAPPVVYVQYGKVSRGSVHRYVTAYGMVTAAPADGANPAAWARVRAPAGMAVARVDCFEGEVVHKGDVLFAMDARNVDAALERARKLVALAKSNAEQMDKATAETLWHRLEAGWQLAVAQGDLDLLKAQRERLEVVSPLSGTVSTLGIRPGEIPDQRYQWIDIIDTNRLAVEVSIPEFELASVAPGREVHIEVPAARSAEADSAGAPAPAVVMGTVRLVDAAADAATGMGSLDVALAPGAALRAGELVKVGVVAEEHRDVLLVPAEALVEQPDGEEEIILVIADVAYPKKVAIGLREGDMVEIDAPELKPGQVIVTTGAYGVVGHSKLHEVKEQDDD